MREGSGEQVRDIRVTGVMGVCWAGSVKSLVCVQDGCMCMCYMFLRGVGKVGNEHTEIWS